MTHLGESQQSRLDEANKQLAKDILKEVAQRDGNLKSELQALIDAEKAKAQNSHGLLELIQGELDRLKGQADRQSKNQGSREDAVDSLAKELQTTRQEIDAQNKLFQEEIDRLQQNQSQQTASLASVQSEQNLQRTGGSEKDFRQTVSTIPSSASNDDLAQRLAHLEHKVAELNEHLKEKDKVIQTHTKEIWDMNEKVFNNEKANDIDHIKFREDI